jgi:hypothetical protein
MKFREYVTKCQTLSRHPQKTRIEIIRELSERAGVSVDLLRKCDAGGLVGQYAKAKLIQDATGGRVTIKELCES